MLSKRVATLNALTGHASLPALTLEDLPGAIDALVALHGAAAVRAAIAKQAKLPLGRKKTPEPGLFYELPREDAKRWLDGGNPQKERTNHAIARERAAGAPEHQKYKIMQRVQRKLRKSRKLFMLLEAHVISATTDDWSWERHRAAAIELSLATDGKLGGAQSVDAPLADYSTAVGQPPTGSIRQVRQCLAEAQRLALLTDPSLHGRILLDALKTVAAKDST